MTKRSWWIVVNQDGRGTIEPNDGARADFDDRAEAEEYAARADASWPDLAPHRAILVGECLAPQAKLTVEKVRDIRARFVKGEGQKAIADRFGVSQTAISHIIQGKTWRTV